MDAGTGWIQEAQLIFEDAEMSGTLPELPEFVWSGDFRINGKDRSGLITIPLVDGSGVELDMRFDELHSVRIRGERPSLILIGKPGLVEGCKPANTPQAGTL